MKKRLKKKWVKALCTADYMLIINPTMAINFAYFEDETRKERHCQAIRKRLAVGGLHNTADGWAVGPAKTVDMLRQPATYTITLTDDDGSTTALDLRKYFVDDEYAEQSRRIGIVHDFIGTFLANLAEEVVDQFAKAS